VSKHVGVDTQHEVCFIICVLLFFLLRLFVDTLTVKKMRDMPVAFLQVKVHLMFIRYF